MKLVINSKRIYLHKSDSKRKKNKSRVKSYTEWKQDAESPHHSDLDEAIHQECMRLIGLPTSVDESDVQPILEGGGLFSEILTFGSPPLVLAARERIQKPPEQADDNIVNGEHSQASNSKDIRLEYDKDIPRYTQDVPKSDLQDQDNDNVPIDHEDFFSESKDKSLNNTDKNDSHDRTDEDFIHYDEIPIDDEVVPINNNKDSSFSVINDENLQDDTYYNKITENKDDENTINTMAINDEAMPLIDEEKSTDNNSSNTNDNHKHLPNISSPNKHDLLNIDEERKSITTNSEVDASKDTMAADIEINNDSQLTNKDKYDILDINDNNSSSMILNKKNNDNPIDDVTNSDNRPEDNSLEVKKERNDLNDNNEESNLMADNDPEENDNTDVAKCLSPDNKVAQTKENSEELDKLSPVKNESNHDTNSTSDNSKPSDGSDVKDLITSTLDLVNKDKNKDQCFANKAGQSDLIDLTHLGEVQMNKIPNNTLIDLTFYDENQDWSPLKIIAEENELVDLTINNENNDESAPSDTTQAEKPVIDEIKDNENEDNIMMDILNFDLNSEPEPSTSDANITKQEELVDNACSEGNKDNKADVKIKSETIDSKRDIKMEIEPQPSTSETDTSLMKSIMRRKGKRKADAEDMEEDTETQTRQNKAKARLEHISMADLAKDADDEEEDDDDMSIAQTYADYMPRKLKLGRKHPDPVVETASLSSVEPADVTYRLSLPDDTVRRGLLSALQLEAVVYASQAHEHVLPDGTRAGFLVGDGAGVGKGRTVAGIVFDNYLKGRKRALWFSVSRDLKYDAERDLRDIGAEHITAHNIIEMKYDDDIASSINGDVEEGVIFSTYSSLVSRNNSGCKYSSRLDQLLQWCGPEFDGVIIFDECHKAKNLHTTQTRTGQNVLELQNRLPKARVVYASATGASEPHNMAYMVRLGIWGEGTPFKDFVEFNKAVEKRGVSAMELVAMDIKQRGVYIARQLSFHGVSVRIQHVPMSAALRAVYDDSTKLWSKARIKFEEAVNQNSAIISQVQRRTIWSQFWGNHQRFFKYLCIAAKVEAAVKEAQDAVSNGKCAVIGLQGTGEARTLEFIKNSDAEEFTDFISTSEGVFQNLVEKQFPTEDYCFKVKRRKLSPNRSLSYTEAMQAELLADIKKLGPRLPKNTLDELMHLLGGPSKVAEMTGRVGRMLHKNGATVYESRAWGLVKQENVNMAEKQLFMDGRKDIAIISEAASSGISLQSDRRALNKKRRVHITLELPWSADQAVQQFGRTHRSNQVNAPEYIFLISDLAGERRFASTVAKRLESLGALTHGDRRATETRDLSQFNIDNKYGRLALSKMMRALTGAELPGEALVPAPDAAFTRAVTAALRDVHFYEERNVQKYDTSVFLNRILGIPVDLQNKLFQYYTDTLEGVIDLAKRNGKFDMGILELDSSRGVRLASSRLFPRTHATGGAAVTLHTIICERGMDWASAEQTALAKSGHERTFFRPRAGVKNRHVIMCVSVFPNVKNSLCWVYSPNTGQAKETQLIEDIKKNYSKINKLDVAKQEWDRQYNHALKACRHEQCDNRTVCQLSRSVRTYHILSGCLLSVWKQVEDILLSGRSRTHNAIMRVIRANTLQGLKIIGILIPKKYVTKLQEELAKDPNEKKDAHTPMIDKKPLDKAGPTMPSHSKENIPNNIQNIDFM